MRSFFNRHSLKSSHTRNIFSGGLQDRKKELFFRMAPQTETKAGAGFKAGVKDYRLTYYTPDYQPKDTDILQHSV